MDGMRQKQRLVVMSTAYTYQVSSKFGFLSATYADSTLLASHTYTLLTLEEDKYFPNMTSDVDRMAIRHNWDMLMPRKTLPPCSLQDNEVTNS
jgi:hypothetical protein